MVVLKIKKRFPLGKLVIAAVSIVVISSGAALGTMNAHYTDRATNSTTAPQEQVPQSNTAPLVGGQDNHENSPVSSEPKATTTATNQIASSATTSAMLNNPALSGDSNSVTREVTSNASTTEPTITTDPIPSVAVSSQTAAQESSHVAATSSAATEEPAASTSTETVSQTSTNTPKETTTVEASKPVRKPCHGLSLLGLCISLF